MTRYITIIALLLTVIKAHAQTPTAGFNLSATACIDQRLDITNTSANANAYEWDFCLDDFLTLKSSTDITVSGLSAGYGYKLINTDDEWIAFVISRTNNRLYRLDFGNSPENFPTIVDLGNPDSKLSAPEGIEIVKSNGNWFGFVGSLNFSSSTQGVIRLDFGTSLKNTPVAKNLGNFGITTRYRDLQVVQQGTNWILILINYNNNAFVRVNYRESLDNNIDASHIINTTISGSNLPAGIHVFKKGTEWIAHVASLSNSKIFQLNFGSDILSTPSVEASYTFTGVNRPYRIKTVQEGDKYYGIVTNESVAIQIIDFKDLVPASVPAAITVNGLPTFLAIDVTRSKGKGIVHGINTTNNILKQLIFESSCSSSSSFSTEETPEGIVFSTAGVKRIELAASNGNEKNVVGKSVTISSLSSPDVAISTDGKICSSAPVTFTANNVSGGITSYNWDFDDSNSGTGVSAAHIYTPGSYTARVDVVAGNGCQNFDKSEVTIYAEPIPDFNVPPGLICTNNNYTISNATTDNYSGNLTYQWLVNDDPADTNRDLTYSFASSGNYDIKLITTIPGCSTEVVKTILNVQQGPVIDFSYTGQCEKDAVIFTNLSTGDINGYQWDFGDTQTSTAVNVSHNYNAHGNYTVSLQASSSNGCQNSTSKDVVIYSKPQPDFTLALPPFSCSGSASQFSDGTPNPTDSNLQSWLWDFGDPSSGQNGATQKNPQHTYVSAGNYSVSLKITTDFSCSASVQKNVTIAQSPDATITNTAPCKDQTVQFNAQKTGNQAWYWQIGNAFYFIDNPTYVFTTTGSRDVFLTVTGNNNCVSSSTKKITVPNTLLPDFSVEKNCVGQNTKFTDITPASNDAVIEQAWDFTNGSSGTGSPITHAFANIGDYNITMQVKTQAGCYYSIAKKITVVSSPVASFTATPETGVPPLEVQFTNTSQNATSYLWAFNDENNLTSTADSPTFTFQDFGDYVVDLTASNAQGCTNTLSKIIRAALPYNDISLTAFTVSENDNEGTLICIATLKNNGNLNIDAVDLVLNISGGTALREKIEGPIAPGTTLNHVVGYEVLKSSQLNYICAEAQIANDDNTDNNKVCTQVGEASYLFDPYPNPVTDQLNIDWISPDEEGKVYISLVDPMGKAVISGDFPSVKGLNQSSLDVDTVEPGIYVLSIQAGTLKKIQRIVISR